MFEAQIAALIDHYLPGGDATNVLNSYSDNDDYHQLTTNSGDNNHHYQQQQSLTSTLSPIFPKIVKFSRYTSDNPNQSSQTIMMNQTDSSIFINNSSTINNFTSFITSTNDSNSNQSLYSNHINNNTYKSSTMYCEPHAPIEMLDEWKQILFGTLIFLTAIITFALNLFVIITLILNRYYSLRPSSSSSTRSSTTSSSSSPSGPNSKSTSITSLQSSSTSGRRESLAPGNYEKKLSINSTDSIGNHLEPNHIHQQRSSSIKTTTSIASTSLMMTNKKKFSHTQQSFISLSLSVILYSSICVPAMYLETIEQLPSVTCSNCFIILLLRFCFYVAPIASSFMHLLMAFDRYLAIKQCYLFQSYWYRRHYTLCIFMVWTLSIVIIVPFFWYDQYGRTIQIILTLIRLMLTFSIPSLLTLLLYLNIACELKRKTSENRLYMLHSIISNNNLLIRKHRKIIVKIIILAFIHFFCWFPFSVLESLNDLFPEQFQQCQFQLQTYYCTMAILILITSMSGIAYPILYCFVSKEFRKIFGQKFSIFTRKHSHQ